MPHHTKEDCERLGIPLRDVIHRYTRRANYEDYFAPGRYGITIHLEQDEEGHYPKDLHLSQVVSTTTHLTKVEAAAIPPKDRAKTALTNFGTIVDAKIREIGQWSEPRIQEQYGNIKLISHVCMPTHIHLILEITRPLPVATRQGKPTQLTLSDFIRSWKQGTTSAYYRLQAGESPASILAHPRSLTTRSPQPLTAHSPRPLTTSPRPLTATSPRPILGESKLGENKPPLPQARPSIWQPNYSDRILNTHTKLMNWIRYVEMNPYYWHLKDIHSNLFEHRLHINLHLNDGTVLDCSAYGCMFLLRKGERIQVMCHRLARKGMLTAEEWQRYADNKDHARDLAIQHTHAKHLGHYDRDWLTSRNPDCICPIPYTDIEHFLKYKEHILTESRQGTIPVSPAISEGEKQIMEAVSCEGLPVIKLRKEAFTEKSHPTDHDRNRCAEGIMLVIAPWDVPGGSDTLYDQFHNMNAMAAKMCGEIGEMSMRVE